MTDKYDQISLFGEVGEWEGMPSFTQNEKKPFKKCSIFIEGDSSVIFIRFEREDDFKKGNPLASHFDGEAFYFESRSDLSAALGQKITRKTKSLWHPFKAHRRVGAQPVWESHAANPPKYPIYIISKGRSTNCKTAKVLNGIGVDFTLVVEPQEFLAYRAEFPSNIIMVTPFSNLGLGSIPVRNYVWDHAISIGSGKHWILDDNIEGFHRLDMNEKYRVSDGSIFKACEDFTDRFSNVKISGMNYYSFCKATDKTEPYRLNTRIYSCTLIDNSLRHRWRGKYNEDTDLCIRSLKDGDCTILFNAFLCGKITTQRVKGGNTCEVYSGTNNRLEFAESLRDQHPDVADVVWRFNRWHHSVNYSSFSKNRLIRCDESKRYAPNEYGMKLTGKKRECK